MDWQHEKQSVDTCLVALLPQKSCACLRGLQFVSVHAMSQHAWSEARTCHGRAICMCVLVVGMLTMYEYKASCSLELYAWSHPYKYAAKSLRHVCANQGKNTPAACPKDIRQDTSMTTHGKPGTEVWLTHHTPSARRQQQVPAKASSSLLVMSCKRACTVLLPGCMAS